MSQQRNMLFGVVASGLLAGLCLVSLGPLEVFELKTLDLRFRWRELWHETEPRSLVRTVVVDDATLRAYGPWPLAHDCYARALDRLSALGARTIGLEVLVLPSDSTNARQQARDARLVAALGAAPGTVMGAYLGKTEGADTILVQRLRPVPATKIYPWPRRWPADFVPEVAVDARDLPMPGVAEAARRIGHLELEVDTDGVLRSVPLVTARGRMLYPSLVLQMVCEYDGVAPRDVEVGFGDAILLRRDGRIVRRIPIDAQGRMLVNYRKRQKSGDVSLVQLLAGPEGGAGAAGAGGAAGVGGSLGAAAAAAGAALDCQGRAVVLGTTARVLADFYPTSLAPLVADVDILAEALETALTGDFVHHAGRRLQFAVTWAFLLAAALLMLRLSPWRGVLVGLGLMFLYLVLEKSAFIWGNVWLDFVRPMFALQVAMVVFPLVNYRGRSRALLDEMSLLRGFDDMILRSMTNGLLVAGRDGRVLKHNPQAARLLGRSGEEFEGRHLLELFAASRVAVEFLERGLASGGGRGAVPNCDLPAQAPVAYPSSTHEGDAILHLSLGLVDPALRQSRQSAGDPYFVLTFSDVTEQVLLLQEDERRARLAAIGEIAAKLGHEIRNSLGGLRLYVENVREETKPDSAGRRAIDSMVDEIEILYRKIDELREYARDPQLEIADCDLKQLLEEALAFSGQKLQEKRMRVTLECQTRMPPLALDRRQMREAFQNLINNAVEAAPEGGHLRIAAERLEGGDGAGQSGAFRLQFEDDGPGISPEVGDQVFSLFFTTKPDIGTGLGLSIVKKIVESHGGKVSFSSAPGRGACFTVTLPPARRLGEV